MKKKSVSYSILVVWLGLTIGFLFASQRASKVRASDQTAHSLALKFPFKDEQIFAASFIGGNSFMADETRAEQVFKNIQVLKGLPSSELYPVMNFMRVSLGVQCSFCHVRAADGKWDYASDQKPEKKTTREMIQLVLNVNKESFNGRTEVSCYTCHRSQTNPVSVPPINATTANQNPPANRPPQSASLPTAEQILSKYTEAIGGAAAIEKLKTRWAQGTLTMQNQPSERFEIYQQAPNKYLLVLTTANGVIRQGFDGQNGWSGNEKGTQALSGAMLAEVKRNADFFADLKLKEQYQRLRVVGKDRIGEHEVYVVVGRTADNRNERLYFDADSGLLLRRVVYTPTMIGQVPEITDYEDYREVDGVKIPFVKRRAQLGGFEASTFKLTEVKFNAPVDESKFNMPNTSK